MKLVASFNDLTVSERFLLSDDSDMFNLILLHRRLEIGFPLAQAQN